MGIEFVHCIVKVALNKYHGTIDCKGIQYLYGWHSICVMFMLGG